MPLGETGEESTGERAPKVVGAKKLSASASWLLVADVVFTAGRALTLFVLGTLLGSEGLGRYLAILGLTQLLFPIIRVGIAHVMVRSISQGGELGRLWPKVLSVHVFGGVVGVGVSVFLSGLLFGASPVATILIGLSQFIGLGVLQAGNMAAAALGRSSLGLVNNGISTMLRVGALGLFAMTISDHSFEQWAWFLAASMLLTAFGTTMLFRATLGTKLRLELPDRSDLSLGAGFVFVDFANSAQADIDKVVLGAFGLNADLGVYGAANRVAEVTNLPLTALVRASYSEFFRRGSGTIESALNYAKKLTALSTGYGFAMGACLWIAAPLLEPLMGEEFRESVSALRWIAILPALRALQVFPANVLSGTDRQWTRAKLLIGTAAFNLAVNVSLAPQFGWRAAAAATLAAESVFAALLWLAVYRAVRAERPG